MVPTFTWGLERSNFSLAIAKVSSPTFPLILKKDRDQSASATKNGAHNQSRTGDLFLTKEVLYRLSYMSSKPSTAWHCKLERVAGIEPASSAWKAEVLPLNYTRLSANL